MPSAENYLNTSHVINGPIDQVQSQFGDPAANVEITDFFTAHFLVSRMGEYFYIDVSKGEDSLAAARIDTKGNIGAGGKPHEKEMIIHVLGWMLNPETNEVPKSIRYNASFAVSAKILSAIYADGTLSLENLVFVFPQMPSEGFQQTLAAGRRETHPPKRFLRPARELEMLQRKMVLGRSQESLFQLIQYRFSDGETVSAEDIFQHPYSALIPENLVLGVPKNQVVESEYFEKFDRRWFVNKEMSNLFLSLLAEAIGSEKVDVLITPTKEVSLERKAMLVEKVDSDYQDGFSWEFVPDSLGLKIEIRFSFKDCRGFDYHRGLIVDFAKNRLIFTSMEQQIAVLKDVMGCKDLEWAVKDEQLVGSGYVEGLQGFSKINGRLKKQLMEQFSVKLPTLDVTQLQAEDFSMRVQLDSRLPDECVFQIVHKDHGWRFNPVSQLQFSFLQPIFYGLGTFFPDENSDIAAKEPARRTRDLKLLRHSGLYCTLLADYISRAGQSEGLREGLSQTLFEAFGALAKKGDSLPADKKKGLKTYFSDRVLDRLQFWFKELEHLKDEPLYVSHAGQIFSIENYLIFTGVIDTLFKVLTSLHGKRMFSKQSFRDAELEFTDQGLRIKHPGVYQCCMAVLDDQTEIEVDQNLIEALKESDLQTKIEITHNSMDWFDLHPTVFFRGEALSIESALKLQSGELIEHNGQFYRVRKDSLPQMKWLDFFWQNLHQESSQQTGERGEQFVALPKSHILNMLALKKAGIEISGDEKWQEIESQFENLGKDADFGDQFGDTAEQLKDYQKIGLKWLDDISKLQLGGILADDMGLGKTIQALALLDLMRIEGRLKSALVVVPTTLVYNWVKESEKFFPHLPVKVFDRESRGPLESDLKEENGSIYVSSYGMFSEHSDVFLSGTWTIAIFDEAQNLKSIGSKRTGIARTLKAKNKFCLTGTPMENHYGEFYSLIDLVVPGALGDYKEFMSVFSAKKMRETGARFDERHIEFLRLKTAPLLLRRTKEKILTELPAKMETVVQVPFEEEQQKIYRDVAISWNRRIRDKIDTQGEGATQIEMLTALLRLRQICSFPAAVPKVVYDKTPPKLELLRQSLGELYENGHSALVFTTFLSSLDYLEKILQEAGIQCLKITGDMGQKKRMKVLEDFEKLPTAVLLMTLKTGGVGLNLTKASYVFHVEPWWNPAAENQATDRVHRIGQTQKVQVYRYIVEHSVEEKIQQLKQLKSLAFDNLLDDKGEARVGTTVGGAQLSQKDFEFLLS